MSKIGIDAIFNDISLSDYEVRDTVYTFFKKGVDFPLVEFIINGIEKNEICKSELKEKERAYVEDLKRRRIVVWR